MPTPRYAVVRWSSDSCAVRLVDRRRARPLPTAGDGWYNEHRPHTTLVGQTPNEVYHDRNPDNQQPRHDPRLRWPHRAPCAAPPASIRGESGTRLEISLHLAGQRQHLPIVTFKRAA